MIVLGVHLEIVNEPSIYTPRGRDREAPAIVDRHEGIRGWRLSVDVADYALVITQEDCVLKKLARQAEQPYC
jgi:hypothetical protein